MENSDDQTYNFRRLNVTNWKGILGLVLTVLVIFSVASNSIYKTPWESKSSFILSVSAIGLLLLTPTLFQLLTKIQISEDGIYCSTPLGNYDFTWREIQVAEIYYVSRHSIDVIDSDQAQQYLDEGTGSIMIWISKSDSNYSSGGPFAHKGEAMEFDFDPKAWKLIQHYRQH